MYLLPSQPLWKQHYRQQLQRHQVLLPCYRPRVLDGVLCTLRTGDKLTSEVYIIQYQEINKCTFYTRLFYSDDNYAVKLPCNGYFRSTDMDIHLDPDYDPIPVAGI